MIPFPWMEDLIAGLEARVHSTRRCIEAAGLVSAEPLPDGDAFKLDCQFNDALAGWADRALSLNRSRLDAKSVKHLRGAVELLAASALVDWCLINAAANHHPDTLAQLVMAGARLHKADRQFADRPDDIVWSAAKNPGGRPEGPAYPEQDAALLEEAKERIGAGESERAVFLDLASRAPGWANVEGKAKRLKEQFRAARG